MGASSSINALNPPKIHVCKPLIHTDLANMNDMEIILKNYGFNVSSTNSENNISNVQKYIFESDIVIICIAKCTIKCFNQLREFDYTKRCYKKCIYVMLDRDYNPEYETWINRTIKDCPWISCVTRDDIESTSQFLYREISTRI